MIQGKHWCPVVLEDHEVLGAQDCFDFLIVGQLVELCFTVFGKGLCSVLRVWLNQKSVPLSLRQQEQNLHGRNPSWLLTLMLSKSRLC